MDIARGNIYIVWQMDLLSCVHSVFLKGFRTTIAAHMTTGGQLEGGPSTQKKQKSWKIPSDLTPSIFVISENQYYYFLYFQNFV